MKKFLLPITLVIALAAMMIAGCEKKEKEREYYLIPALDTTCTCGAAYHLAYNIQLFDPENPNEASTTLQEYPSGKSTMWTLTCNGKAYPFSTYKEMIPSEGYCQWTCSCGKTFKFMEMDFYPVSSDGGGDGFWSRMGTDTVFPLPLR